MLCGSLPAQYLANVPVFVLIQVMYLGLDTMSRLQNIERLRRDLKVRSVMFAVANFKGEICLKQHDTKAHLYQTRHLDGDS